MKKLTIKYVFNPSDKLSKIYSNVLNSVNNKHDKLIEIDIIIGGFPVINRNLKFTKYDIELIKKYNINPFISQLQQQESIDLNNENFKLATAMCVFKERFPEKAIEFAVQLHQINCREENKIELLSALAKLLGYDEIEFKRKLAEKKYKVQAYSQFELIKNKIVINSYPTTFIEMENKIRVLFSGYICLNRLKEIYEEPDKSNLFYTLKDVLYYDKINLLTENI